MPTKFFYNNKTGIIWPTRQVLIFAFAVLVTIAMFVFISDLKAAILSEPDDGSKANFDKLYRNINVLIENSDENYRIINYNLGNSDEFGRFLVGFDRNWNNEKQVTNDGNIYRPTKGCGISACLCLYTKTSKWNKDHSRNENVKSCRSDGLAGKNIIFTSEGSDDLIPRTIGISREDGNDHYLVFDGADWGVQRLYIEKTTKDSTINIYIAKIDTDDPNNPANKRKLKIDTARETT